MYFTLKNEYKHNKKERSFDNTDGIEGPIVCLSV